MERVLKICSDMAATRDPDTATWPHLYKQRYARRTNEATSGGLLFASKPFCTVLADWVCAWQTALRPTASVEIKGRLESRKQQLTDQLVEKGQAMRATHPHSLDRVAAANRRLSSVNDFWPPWKDRRPFDSRHQAWLAKQCSQESWMHFRARVCERICIKVSYKRYSRQRVQGRLSEYVGIHLILGLPRTLMT